MRSAPRALCVAASGLVAGALAAAAPSAPAAAKDIVIKMAVPDWPPTRIMQDLANERYKAPSGNNVKLEADFIPWPVYYERLAASLTSGEKKYQMAVSDSQWLGAFVEGGYYLKINKFIDADPELQAAFKDMHPNLVDAYSTYPHKTQNYYGFPQMPDVLAVYYRKDLFCDPVRAAGLPGQVRHEAAVRAGGDGQRRLGPGEELRRVLPALQGPAAGRQT
jgi:multiple sugar transport system substrate-binding protein